MKTLVLSLALLAMPVSALGECNDIDLYTFKKCSKITYLVNKKRITSEEADEVVEYLRKCQSFLANETKMEACHHRFFLELYVP